MINHILELVEPILNLVYLLLFSHYSLFIFITNKRQNAIDLSSKFNYETTFKYILNARNFLIWSILIAAYSDLQENLNYCKDRAIVPENKSKTESKTFTIREHLMRPVLIRL